MNKAELKKRVLALAATKQPDLKGMDLNKWAAENIAALKAELSACYQNPSPLIAEVIEAPTQREWSPSDPSCTDAVIKAVIRHGDYEEARAALGCPEDIFDQIIADGRFGPRLKEAMGVAMIPKIIKAAPGFIEDSAYGADKMAQIFKALGADEAEAQQARHLKSGGTKARVKALMDIIKEAARQIEVLTGGHTPLPAEIEEIVRSVSTQEKAGRAA